MNSNPFEPVSPEPATFEPTDSAPDDFMADSNNNNGAAKPARPAVMLDGVSPAPASTSFDPNTPPVDITTMGSALAPNEGPFEGSGAGDTTANTSDTSDSLLNDNDAPNDDFLNDASEPAKDTDTSTPILSGMLPDDKPVDDKADKKKAKKDKKGDKPARQFTISIDLHTETLIHKGKFCYFHTSNWFVVSNIDRLRVATLVDLASNFIAKGFGTADMNSSVATRGRP